MTGREVTLGDLINVKHGYAFSGQDITPEVTPLILVTPGNFYIGGGFKSDKFKYFNGEYPKEYVLKQNDIVVTMTDLSKEGDTLGYSAKIPKSNGKIYLHNQRIGLVEIISDEIDKDYLYWLLRTNEYQGFILGAATGTSVRHTSPTTIKQYIFSLPSLLEQKSIASILTSLDDKIDLLHRQNKTLESMAESLFRQYFMENICKNEKITLLGEIVRVTNGKARPEENEDGLIPVYGGNGILGSTYKSNANGFSIIIGRVGAYCGSLFIENRPIWVSDNAMLATPTNPDTYSYVFYLLKSLNLNEYAEGSSHPLLTQTLLNSIQITAPSGDKIHSFCQQADVWIKKTNHNYSQISTIEKLRDTLLPKLLAGEIRVT